MLPVRPRLEKAVPARRGGADRRADPPRPALLRPVNFSRICRRHEPVRPRPRDFARRPTIRKNRSHPIRRSVARLSEGRFPFAIPVAPALADLAWPGSFADRVPAAPGLPGLPVAITLARSSPRSRPAPLVFCHRMSDLPSPLKSPVPMTCQLGAGVADDSARDDGECRSSARSRPAPLVFCHRMSALPSPLKSPVPIDVPARSRGCRRRALG